MSVQQASAGVGAEMHALCAQLYPVLRSITGNGVRKTLRALQEYLPLQMLEVPTGVAVFDWTVPCEWNVDDAYIANEHGERVVDLRDHSLHLVSYSEPMRARLTLDELQKHLHSLPEHPEWIPYRTSYYERAWGFCLTHAQRQQMRPGLYDVVIESRIEPGSLTYGEYVVPGELDQEVLIWTHVCHPSLANDNLSGIAVATFLAKQLAEQRPRPTYTHRFVFAPSTIGAITWLAQNEERLARIAAGLVISGVGDRGGFTYKRSRADNSIIDRVIEHTLAQLGSQHRIEPFSPYGYDERQFCSPGLNLPVGCLMRTPFGRYPQYHTSADNLEFISAQSLAEALELCAETVRNLQCVRTYRNLSPKCEPQLGRRGLYDSIGGESDKKSAQMALLWMLSYSDGSRSTLDISDLSGLQLDVLHRAAERLQDAQLLAPC
ncbi:MAG: DUF4910 domain-containing protein [Steroidobacter sp.]